MSRVAMHKVALSPRPCSDGMLLASTLQRSVLPNFVYLQTYFGSQICCHEEIFEFEVNAPTAILYYQPSSSQNTPPTNCYYLARPFIQRRRRDMGDEGGTKPLRDGG